MEISTSNFMIRPRNRIKLLPFQQLCGPYDNVRHLKTGNKYHKNVTNTSAFVNHSLAQKSNFAGHVIITTGLQRMHFPRPGSFLRWNSNL